MPDNTEIGKYLCIVLPKERRREFERRGWRYVGVMNRPGYKGLYPDNIIMEYGGSYGA